jgi:hypothetical protein
LEEVLESGKCSLISDYFYYFGDNPIDLPDNLLQIVHQTQGHKSNANNQYKHKFVKWIKSLDRYKPNELYGEPQLDFLKILHVKEHALSLERIG